MKKYMLILSLLMVGGLQARRGWYQEHVSGHVSGAADQYTPLMRATSLAQVKDLVDSKHADINAATWQYDWIHYVTALDCFTYNYSLRHSAEDLAIVNFLKSKGAKSAEDLPGWSTFRGAVRLSK